MPRPSYLCLPIDNIPSEEGWLLQQSVPVIAVGDSAVSESSAGNADMIVASMHDTELLVANIERTPLAAMVLVQVLRAVDQLPLEAALTMESLAYATLQAGAEYRNWLDSREDTPRLIAGGQGEAVALQREGNVVKAVLNRPANRNSITVEMRDALVELLELVLLDDGIEIVHISGRGACFSVGGELAEFGLAPSPAEAHQIRSVHNPGRLLARCAARVRFHVHRACVGSGIEIPAFAAHISADPNCYFQLPELKFGLIPGAGGCVSISRRIGRQRTAWLALSGKRINAQLALEWGLIDELAGIVA
ncbi:MAG: enoyl-CoA hydratase/isomerase family protein [Pseudomonadales bacterium]